MVKGTKNFSRSELEYSDTAIRYKINNRIPPTMEANAQRLLEFLQPIREAWGSGIKITSGYRCDKLNRLVGGSLTSAHMRCNAADLQPSNGRMMEFKKFIINYLKDKNFDQCIIEKSGSTEWIHLGLYNNAGLQRRSCFKLTK